MDRLEVLGKIQKFSEKWEGFERFLLAFGLNTMSQLAGKAKEDFLSIQHEIEKSLDEEAEGLLKQEQKKQE